MVNIEKYKNNGWGLSRKCFLDIENILSKIDNPNIVEFGSGVSTEFFVDYLNENNKDGKITSFDDSEELSSKIVDKKLNLKIRKLVECDDNNFKYMFEHSNYDASKMEYRKKAPHTRQKNCFYEITPADIEGTVDLAVVDGPHGNGRSLSFLHLINHLKSGSFVVIDDYNHYDFVEKFTMIFPDSELISESSSGRKNQWESGGIYKIFKLK